LVQRHVSGRHTLQVEGRPGHFHGNSSAADEVS
jgi:hypothetical protein